MPADARTIERLRALHDDADRALNAASDALEDLARAFHAAGDTRAADALRAYLISSLDGWMTSQHQCGGMHDMARSIDALESGETED